MESQQEQSNWRLVCACTTVLGVFAIGWVGVILLTRGADVPSGYRVFSTRAARPDLENLIYCLERNEVVFRATVDRVEVEERDFGRATHACS